jgi:hypothetical protein
LNNEPLECDRNDGFKWSYGPYPQTKGIWMWNKPIDFKLKTSNKEVSKLLLTAVKTTL